MGLNNINLIAISLFRYSQVRTNLKKLNWNQKIKVLEFNRLSHLSSYRTYKSNNLNLTMMRTNLKLIFRQNSHPKSLLKIKKSLILNRLSTSFKQQNKSHLSLKKNLWSKRIRFTFSKFYSKNKYNIMKMCIWWPNRVSLYSLIIIKNNIKTWRWGYQNPIVHFKESLMSLHLLNRNIYP